VQMKIARILVGLGILTVLPVGCGEGPGGLAWSDRPLSGLLIEAREQDRPILVLICPEAGKGWACGPLDEEASEPGARKWAGKALALRLSASEPDAGRLIRLHSIEALPSLLLFSAEGDLLVRRDGAQSFLALQPDPGEPVPLEKVAAVRSVDLAVVRRTRENARLSLRDIESALAQARRAAEKQDSERAAAILGRILLDDLNTRQIVSAAETAEMAGRDDLASNLWKLFLDKNPDIGARAETLARYAASLVRTGQDDRLRDMVFTDQTLRNQWEYLSVAAALAGEGRERLASRVASHGLARFPEGPDTRALRFYTEQEE